MKRSEINQIAIDSIDFIESCGFPFAQRMAVTPKAWSEMGLIDQQIMLKGGLGIDVTPFGGNDFLGRGLFALTLANPAGDLTPGVDYCHKLMVVRPDQETPLHCHKIKVEDIIVHSGRLMIKLYKVGEDGKPDETSNVEVLVNYERRTFEAGAVLMLQPGDRVTLTNDVFHVFWGDPDCDEWVLVMEVSKPNDDVGDNVFADDSVLRFPGIDEDEEPRYYLVGDYAKHAKAA